jgi:formylglycine-generating enzyme required for sulfatase activity
VPIGLDRKSLLWEFVHLASGTPGKEFPVRDPATQRLVPTGDMGLVFVLIPGGSLPTGTKDAGSDTSVRLGVKLDAFFLGKYEVTQGQWLRLTGGDPLAEKQDSLALPVEPVSWFDSEEVLRHQGLVLPSELRWEYAIRAGTTTAWWTGDTQESVKAKENIGGGSLLSVGSKAANGFGLFDMGGNLFEWCLDVYEDYGTERVGDGLRPGQGDGAAWRCVRGGAFGGSPVNAKSHFRINSPPGVPSDFEGLRAARTFRR